ncbi:unnamed protein product [Chrysodeixis includens]|uniref:Uncharacterized protein n=1 Tax=Chrysodeixis includens TaxID=689277 RepID=A0A9P0BWK8_CHRIL|nr:unnamed protein product [Chrysodeixis includens]
MCSPCGPMVCYKYEDCGPPKGKSSNRGPRVEEDGGEKKNEKENQLKRTKSRELRGGIMYYSCHCIKRNGLQHDCRRTGCGGEPACLVLPDPLCAPSQLARARGLADPAALAAHTRAHSGAGSGKPADSGSGSGKRFIVCELKGMVPDVSMDKTGKCCKCPEASVVPHHTKGPISGGGAKPYSCICPSGASRKVPVHTPVVTPVPTKCSCNCGKGHGWPSMQPTKIVVDDIMFAQIFEPHGVMTSKVSAVGPGGRSRKAVKSIPKEEPCTREGCIHWQPPPPCVWDLPCKADCFETHASAQPGRNPLTRGGGGGFITVVDSPGRNDVSKGGAHHPRERMKLLTPECCTGCSAATDGGAMASGGPAAGLPMLVMKLC